MCGGREGVPRRLMCWRFALYLEALLLYLDQVLTNELIQNGWTPLMSSQLCGIVGSGGRLQGMFLWRTCLVPGAFFSLLLLPTFLPLLSWILYGEKLPATNWRVSSSRWWSQMSLDQKLWNQAKQIFSPLSYDQIFCQREKLTDKQYQPFT